jgi:transcriptional regulator with XRE-family HTH domain
MNPVAELLERSGLTKTDFARRTGMSRSQLDRYLKGETSPTVAQLRRIADSLSLQVSVRVHRLGPHEVAETDATASPPRVPPVNPAFIKVHVEGSQRPPRTEWPPLPRAPFVRKLRPQVRAVLDLAEAFPLRRRTELPSLNHVWRQERP